jgi:EAL domain-containing protein (putative c-di-GMP-specific phosphodiesterase class I)
MLLIRLAHALSLSVTAESVETASQLHQLRELGCDLGQGWYFSPAVDAASVTELLLRPGRSTWPNRPGPRFWSNDTRGVG